MMKNNIINITGIALLFFSVTMFSCKKDDYLKGGSVHTTSVNLTTYDFLQSNAWQQFDTVLQLVDKAGLKDLINQQGATFFAPNDYAVYNYLSAKTIKAQKIDPYAKYTLDSLFKYDLQTIKDSLKMYIITQSLTYDKLTNNGAKYVTALAGDTAVVSYEYTNNGNLGYNSTVSNVPQVVYFTQLWQPLPVPFVASEISDDIGVHTLCTSSGIQTTTGIVHVLESSHTLFFYGTN